MSIVYQIPIVGMPYEFVTTGSVRHSAPGSIAQFLAISAGKRATHAFLGSAGGMMPYQHYIQIAKEEAANLKKVVGKQPPRAGALTVLSTAPVLSDMMENMYSYFDITSSESHYM